MNTDYLKELPELEIAIMAKNGDVKAMEFLWLKYRKVMINVLYHIDSMTYEEKESEVAVVFMHHLIHLLDPEKPENQKEGWVFFSYLYSGMAGYKKNLLKKLRRERAHVSYDESDDDPESASLNAEKVCVSNRDLYLRYDPERAVITELCVNTKLRRLQDSIDRVKKIKTGYFRRIREMLGGI
jgi:hypothetical protein